MAESKDFSAEAGTAKVIGTVSSTDIAEPIAPPTGLRAVGPRITFHFTGEWDAETSYVLYDVVHVNGTSYIANKVTIAKGVNPETDNNVHWVQWNDPNAQVALLQQTVNSFDSRITGAETEAMNAAADAAEAKKASSDNAAAIEAEATRAKSAEAANAAAIEANTAAIAKTKSDIKIVGTVSEFANLTLEEGAVVKTNGYSEFSDGGDAFYIIGKTKTSSFETGSFPTANGLFANIIQNGKSYNVKQYGFNTTEEIDGDKLTDFFSKIPFGATAFFPLGIYTIKGGFTVGRANILGEALSTTDQDRTIGSVLKFSEMAASANCILLTANMFVKNIKIDADTFTMTENRERIGEDVDVFTPNATVESVNGIRIQTGVYGCEFENVVVVRCSGYGILGALYSRILNVAIYQCANGFYLKNDNVLNSVRIVNCKVGIICDGALNVIDNVRMDSIQNRGLYIPSTGRGQLISNVDVDYCQGPAIVIDSADDISISNITGRCGTYSPANSASVATDSANNTNIEGCLVNVRGGGAANNVSIQGAFRQSNPLDHDSNLIVPKNFVTVSGNGAHTVHVMQGGTTENLTSLTSSNAKAVVNSIGNAKAKIDGIILGSPIKATNNVFTTPAFSSVS